MSHHSQEARDCEQCATDSFSGKTRDPRGSMPVKFMGGEPAIAAAAESVHGPQHGVMMTVETEIRENRGSNGIEPPEEIKSRTGSKFWDPTHSVGENLLAGIDRAGEWLAYGLGITQSRYEMFLDDCEDYAEHRKLEETLEKNDITAKDLVAALKEESMAASTPLSPERMV